MPFYAKKEWPTFSHTSITSGAEPSNSLAMSWGLTLVGVNGGLRRKLMTC